ncbi:YhfG family protein [Pseudomonas sp. RIT288]|jgi:hypothetical protein|uniref:YhfG family protein n=1 Tax=Pseudomonas sp. RIT288 TaxID=1470589 RepID=UPI000445848E|nr:hypothetical protein [Pseudomonas sp. RIT288]EZP28851.1 hypothetical protein BW33_04210 [Pseudomonas sp. RIT288]
MSEFFDALMESVQEMDENLCAQRCNSPLAPKISEKNTLTFYLASLRIEGFETVPADAAESLSARQQILDRYHHDTS